MIEILKPIQIDEMILRIYNNNPLRLSVFARKFVLPLLMLPSLFLFSTTSAQVILNEIMYNPAGNENYTEYVEIYNSGLSPVSLNGWLISDGTAEDSIVPEAGSVEIILNPNDFALILDSGYWTDGDSFYQNVIPPGTLLLTTPDAAIGSRGLSNSTAESVSLISSSGQVVSSRTYRLDAPDGVSEERINVEGGEGDDNWQFSQPGGTPGTTNNQPPSSPRLNENILNVSPNPFSPDGNGFEDYAVFSFDIPNAATVEITLRIFDVNGRLLSTPLFNSRMPSNASWDWDGRTGTGRVLPMGIYPFHVMIKETSGSRKWETKGTVVSTGSRH
ncbi:MAG: lamin tail domain-containing protein [Candidatus Electryonea clarkiae]|nr:lamin tail domain-containing protein [Candidatus Electryonea clarkiae]MDP8285912.1 lamin tail domain-containing protein [Candidatus Electryonea clarkiae]